MGNSLLLKAADIENVRAGAFFEIDSELLDLVSGGVKTRCESGEYVVSMVMYPDGSSSTKVDCA